MKCKYCDAERDTTPGGIEMWECGTHVSFCDGVTIQSGLCQKNELARYRAMFPIPPWDGSPITPEVCERLGMYSVKLGLGVRWMFGDDRLVLMEDSGKVLAVSGFSDPSSVTAGQLACIVAARKAST